MSFEVVDLYVRDSSPARLPVAGVTVKVMSEDGKLMYSLGTTNANGYLGLLLASEFRYQVRCFKQSVSFTNPQVLVVLPNQTNIFDIAAQLITPPVALDGRLCVAYGFFRGVTGEPAAMVDIQFIAKFDPLLLDGSAVLTERVSVRTNENGYAQVNLIRNAHYDVTIQGYSDVVQKIAVPDAPNVNLPDLLFPVVASLSFDPPGPYTLAVGQELYLDATVMSSDGNTLIGLAVDDVRYSTSDIEVLGIYPTPLKMNIRAGKPGVAYIVVERADKSTIRIPNTPIQTTSLQVTVTP